MASWLYLTSDAGGWCLQDSGRLRHAVHSLEHPNKQRPLVVFLVGGASKQQALRCFLPHNNTTRQGSFGIANLHLRNSNPMTPYPHVYIDGILENKQRRACPVPKRNDQIPVRQYRIRSKQNQPYVAVRDQVFHHGILPFTHVFCIFVDELPESESLEKWLRVWLLAARDEAAARAHLMIVLTDPTNDAPKDEVLESSKLFGEIRRSGLRWMVVDLRDRTELSPTARFNPLQSQLQKEIETARQANEDRRLLFCATHLEALMRKAVRWVSLNSQEPFNLIAAMREDNPVPQGIRYHLANFLQLAAKTKLSLMDIATFVASALAVDAYPPGMHYFDPDIIFDRLYAGHCDAVWRLSSRAAEECLVVKGFFVSFTNRLSQYVRPVVLRSRLLQQNPERWAGLETNLTCLFCLLRGTCESLPCGHAICEICVRRFADQGVGEHFFLLERCDLCQASFTYTVRQVPPTQRPNVLALDGGGVRGFVTLRYLLELARRQGYTRLQDLFELVVGTSVGGLAAIYGFIENYTPEEALEVFSPLARLIFPAKRKHQGPVHFLGNLARNILLDGSYDSETLDGVLAKAFGSRKRLYEMSRHSPAGCRVAITASHVEKNGALCLFSNYRNPERPARSASYEVIAPPNVDNEPLLCEVARCAVAALGYFKTKHLTGLGTFQDGGICANCPVKVALRESSLLWPTSRRPNVVVSIGTGYLDEEDEGTPSAHCQPHVSNLLSQGYIKRAKDAFLSSGAVDGSQGWKEARDSIPNNLRDDVFRLDVALQRLPELDDASSIDDLTTLSYKIPDRLAHMLLSTSFFFELDAEPLLSSQGFRCEGSILCSRNDPRLVLSQLSSEVTEAVFMTDSGENLGRIVIHDGCNNCGYYRKRVNFSVSCLEDDIQIGIVGTSNLLKIGGFPTSIQDIVMNMGVEAEFGRPDHRYNRWPLRQCYCARRGKRRGTSSASRNTGRPRVSAPRRT